MGKHPIDSRFDGTLNTIGLVSYDPEALIDGYVSHTSGRGYAGAEGYRCNLPNRCSRKPAAE